MAEDKQLKRWQDMAQEARTFAEATANADARTAMIKVAESYDLLIERRYGRKLP
jgi:hypothetical protein